MDESLKVSGLSNAWTMPIKGRVDMLTTGVRTPVGLKISGADSATIEQIGTRVESLLPRVQGTRGVFAERTGTGYFLTLIGSATNWLAMVLASRMRNPRRDREDLWEAIAQGAAKRLRPKFMTFATMIIGLLPITWSTGTGADVMKRIGAPMVGGIFASFVLELLVYPGIYSVWRERICAFNPASTESLDTRTLYPRILPILSPCNYCSNPILGDVSFHGRQFHHLTRLWLAYSLHLLDLGRQTMSTALAMIGQNVSNLIHYSGGTGGDGLPNCLTRK